jgi:3-oxoacyl-[acyl-carrier-protein] synthase-1/3-oxoacyl-[acyl-carrier-protein] synthase II
VSHASVIAAGAVSALGVGEDAYRAVDEGGAARSGLGRDAELAAAGLLKPFAGRAPAELPGGEGFDDRATSLLACALAQALGELDEVRPGWRGSRVGVALGTSSGGMLSAERYFACRAANAKDEDLARVARAATYFAPFDDALARAGLGPGEVAKRTQILAACAASTIAIGLGLRWLDRRACDVVIAGGYDGVSVFVAAGFEVLRATTATCPRPFRAGRDGMSLGEGAGIVALVRDDDRRGAKAFVHVTGFGASTDAVHITAPDRTGGGLARAASAAIADAVVEPASIGLVSAHATATPYNDAMESKALARALGEGAAPVVHPFKAQIGHTLGAAGVLEALSAAHAMRTGVAPAAAGDGAMDPEASALLLPRAEERRLDRALKLSAAFGGTNAALVLAAEPAPRAPRPPRKVFVRAAAHAGPPELAALAAATGIARDRLARLDALGRVGLAAVAALAAKVGREALDGAGIVAGHALATIDTNDAFDLKKRTRGAAHVEPRLFPATSPNAVAGECAIAYHLTGPGVAVGAGLDGGSEALAAAAEIVAAGDAERMVVLAADDAGPAAACLLRVTGQLDRPLVAGAVALLLDASPEGALGEASPDATIDHAVRPIGHLALLGWADR